jgi:hypothetical protein
MTDPIRWIWPATGAFAARLAEDLGRVPDAETQALAARLTFVTSLQPARFRRSPDWLTWRGASCVASSAGPVAGTLCGRPGPPVSAGLGRQAGS